MSWISLTLIVALNLSEGTAPSPAALRADAEAKMEARAYVDAGEAYLRLASLEGVERRDELFNAHSSFEAAYLTTRDPPALCRALAVAEVVVREGGFRDEQMALFWRELITSDLDRLRDDAAKTKRPNCRFSATGTPRTFVPLLAAEDPSPAMQTLATDTSSGHVQVDMSQESPGSPHGDGPVISRRYRAHTAAGALLVGFGIGSVGLFVGALAIQIEQTRALRGQHDIILAEDREPSAGEELWALERRTAGRQARTLAISSGVVAAVTLATGGALLGTRRRFGRPISLRPYGSTQGAGFVLRGKF